MKQKGLIPILKEHGISDAEVRELLIFTLNTKDRQEQMLNWILENEETCNREEIRKKAQELLQGFLAGNPYNAAAKRMSPPKWEPPCKPKPKAPVEPKQEVKQPKKTADEIYFENLLRVFKP